MADSIFNIELNYFGFKFLKFFTQTKSNQNKYSNIKTKTKTKRNKSKFKFKIQIQNSKFKNGKNQINPKKTSKL